MATPSPFRLYLGNMKVDLYKKIELLNKATLSSLRESSTSAVFRSFTESAIKILGADFGFVWFKNEEGQDYRLAYRSPNTPYNPPHPRPHGINIKVFKTRRPFFSQKVPRSTPLHSRYMRSFISIPISYRNHQYGNLVICFKTTKNFTREDKILSSTLGNSLAQTITINGLYSNLQTFKDTLDRTLDGIFIFNPDTLQIAYVNRGAAVLLRMSENRLMQKTMEDIIPGLYQPRFRGIIESLGQRVDKTFTFETNLLQANGKTLPIEIFIQDIIYPDGSEQFLSIARDITVRKKAENQIKNLLTQKDEFLATAGHELRTPLTTIKGFAQLMQKHIPSTDKNAHYFLSRIEYQVSRVGHLVEELLDISKIETAKLTLKEERVDVNKLMKEVVDDLGLISDGREIVLRGKIKGQAIGDYYRLRQVFVNIINNAIKYSPHNKTIVIKLQQNEKTIIVTIQDFGHGIPKQYQKKVFEKFFQMNPGKGAALAGMGLGLFISREIVLQHHGDIWFESEKGKGTTFYIKLPIKNAPRPQK